MLHTLKAGAQTLFKVNKAKVRRVVIPTAMRLVTNVAAYGCADCKPDEQLTKGRPGPTRSVAGRITTQQELAEDSQEKHVA